MPTEAALVPERIQAVLKQIRRNLNRSLAKKIVKTFEDDPNASFERVIDDALTSYRRRLASARKTAEQQHARESAVDQVPVNPRPQTVFGHQSPSAALTVLRELSPALQVLLRMEPNPPEYNSQTLKLHLAELIDSGTCLHSSPSRGVVQLDSATVVKFGSYVALEELTLLDYASKHTAIPVPEPLGCVQIGKTSYIFTTFVPGNVLERRWATLDVTQKASIHDQLNAMLDQMRSLPYPAGTPLGTLSAPHVCKDYHMTITVSPQDIQNISQFHDFLVSRPFSNVSPSYLRWLRSQLRDHYRVVLSHCDLHPRNILVVDSQDGTIRVSGIVDWEMGGWYPEYWEMYKALNTRGGDDDSDWWDYLPEVILGFDREVLERRVVEQSMRP